MEVLGTATYFYFWLRRVLAAACGMVKLCCALWDLYL